MDRAGPPGVEQGDAIDGKSVRGSGSSLRGQRALHVVSAHASEVGLVLGQRLQPVSEI